MIRENCDADEVRKEVGDDVIGGRSEWTIPVSPGRGGCWCHSGRGRHILVGGVISG
jgi:hypothetical protein